MSNGYILLYRTLKQNPIYTNSNAVHCWVECLLRASYKKREVYLKRTKLNLDPGQFVMGREEFGKSVSMSGSTAWYWIQQFESDNMIDIKKTSKGSIVSIKNWEQYQKLDSTVNNRKTAEKQQKNTYNKDNKVNKVNTSNINTYISKFNKLFDRNFRITDGRIRKLKTRLKEFSFEEITNALENLSQSPFHRGVNDRGWKADPDFLIRNDEQVDKWLNKDMEEVKKLSKISRKGKQHDKSKISFVSEEDL